jgi:hypothetical protein
MPYGRARKAKVRSTRASAIAEFGRLGLVAAQGHPPTTALLELIEQAAELLRQHPRDEKLHRATDRTYLRPAPTQEIAAELLDLPSSTCRRHLTQGVISHHEPALGPRERTVHQRKLNARRPPPRPSLAAPGPRSTWLRTSHPHLVLGRRVGRATFGDS